MKPYTLIRWMDKPILWRYAVRVAAKLPHEHDGHCPPCKAKERLERNTHKPMTTEQRRVACAKCGLDDSKWAARPKCPNKFPKPIIVRLRSAFRTVGWE